MLPAQRSKDDEQVFIVVPHTYDTRLDRQMLFVKHLFVLFYHVVIKTILLIFHFNQTDPLLFFSVFPAMKRFCLGMISLAIFTIGGPHYSDSYYLTDEFGVSESILNGFELHVQCFFFLVLICAAWSC